MPLSVPERVLVIVAHPDDAESHAGGTVAKFVQEGKTVNYVVVTNGDKGSADRPMAPEQLAHIRQDEQRKAAAVLGVKSVTFLGYPDGEVEDTRLLRRDLTREIRRCAPDLVVLQNPNRTPNLGLSHRDHRVVGGAALDCIYPLAAQWMAFPELLEHEPHHVQEIYVMHAEHPALILDIADTITAKVRALACHESQNGGRLAIIETTVRERAAALGRQHGLVCAEGFDRIVVDW